MPTLWRAYRQAGCRRSTAISRSVGFWLGVGICLFPVVFVWFLLRQGHSTTSRIVGFALFAVMVAGMASGERQSSKAVAPVANQSQPARVAAPVAPLFEVSAQQLAQAYGRNTVAADHQFKGKRFRVTGVVARSIPICSVTYVTPRGGVNQFMEPQFELNNAHAEYAAGLQSGMHISLICTGSGDVAKTPMSRDCEPAN